MRLRSGSLALVAALSLTLAALCGPTAFAAKCPADYETLLKALQSSVKPTGGPSNGGLDNNEWSAIVARDGTVCAVVYSGHAVGDQWPASRAIAAEKAFTANGMSLDNTAISTANSYTQAQPGCSIPAIPQASARKPTRWSARYSAGSSCSAADSPCTTTQVLWAGLA